MVDLNIKLSDGFLDEEVRCGYKVSHKMKEVWAVELDLLAEFNRVCKKYNISYCADGGTLLGAVRHQGFIPWDDDIDIGMLRSEFDKLNSIAETEFSYPYFWQTEESDPGSARGHAQLRNSLTTGILKSEYEDYRNNNYNQGIFIDIFPFDNIPDNADDLVALDKNRLYQNALYHERLATINYYHPRIYKDINGKRHFQIRKRLGHLKNNLLKRDYTDAYEKCMNIYRTYDDLDNSTYVADLCIGISMNRIRRFKEDFYNLVNTDFEFLKIPIFKNYDRNLSILYGSNYMTPVNASSEHGTVIFDVDKPYTYYLNNR